MREYKKYRNPHKIDEKTWKRLFQMKKEENYFRVD